MREIELWTALGHEGAKFVAVVDIPPFPDSGMPAVVIWGERVFKARETQPTDARWEYQEVFCVVSVTPSPGRPQSEPDSQLKETEDRIVDGPKRVTLHGGPLEDTQKIDPETGMQKEYIVLSAAERAKGFVRPVRNAYVHVGRKVIGTLRDLTPEERALFPDEDFVKYEEYPQPNPLGSSARGRAWTKKEYERFLHPCGVKTTMGQSLAETYARDPKFYSGTFCAGCGAHFDVGDRGEFVWDGTDIRVGT